LEITASNNIDYDDDYDYDDDDDYDDEKLIIPNIVQIFKY
jgi:hypothetical protein